MRKSILGLTTVAILCSPLVFADDTMGQDQQMSAPSTQDSMPSAPTATTPQPTSNTPSPSTTSTTTSIDVQLKTMNGRVIHAQIDPQDLHGMNVGDKLEVTDLGSAATVTTSNGTNNGTNNGAVSSGASSGTGSNTTSSGASTTNNGTSNGPGSGTDNTGTVNGTISQ